MNLHRNDFQFVESPNDYAVYYHYNLIADITSFGQVLSFSDNKTMNRKKAQKLILDLCEGKHPKDCSLVKKITALQRGGH